MGGEMVFHNGMLRALCTVQEEMKMNESLLFVYRKAGTLPFG